MSAPTYNGARYSSLIGMVNSITMRPLHSDLLKKVALEGWIFNAVLRDLMRRHDFGCMERELELVTVASSPNVAIESGGSEEWIYKGMAEGKDEEGCVYYLNAAGKHAKIRMMRNGEVLSLPRLRELYPDPTEEGAPAYCCIFNREIWLGPTPDAVYDLRVPAYVMLPDFPASTAWTSGHNWFVENLDDILMMEWVALARLVLDEPSAVQVWAGVSEATLDRAIAVDKRERVTRVGARSARLRQA